MQKVTFTVNAARRFRYTLDIKKFEEQQLLKKDPASRFRAGTHVIRVSIFQSQGFNGTYRVNRLINSAFVSLV
jgi:hypothetical protein